MILQRSSQTKNMDDFHIYLVGMGTNRLKIKAQSAAAASMYFSLRCVTTNNPFMAVVYTEDGQPWEGDRYWLKLSFDDDHVSKVMTPELMAQIELASVFEE